MSKKKCPNNKKEIYNDKYRHTRDRLFGLRCHIKCNLSIRKENNYYDIQSNINKPQKKTQTQNIINSDNPSTKQRPGAMRAVVECEVL